VFRAQTIYLALEQQGRVHSRGESLGGAIREIEPRFALNDLMKACGLSGESGSETLFHVLSDAIDEADWSIVEQSHAGRRRRKNEKQPRVRHAR